MSSWPFHFSWHWETHSIKTQPSQLWLQSWLFWRGSEFHAKGGSEVQAELHGLECLKSRNFLRSSFGNPDLTFWPLQPCSWWHRNAATCCRFQPSPRPAQDSGPYIRWNRCPRFCLDDVNHHCQEATEARDKYWRGKGHPDLQVCCTRQGAARCVQCGSPLLPMLQLSVPLGWLGYHQTL